MFVDTDCLITYVSNNIIIYVVDKILQLALILEHVVLFNFVFFDTMPLNRLASTIP
jgi:hypothetical protein